MSRMRWSRSGGGRALLVMLAMLGLLTLSPAGSATADPPGQQISFTSVRTSLLRGDDTTLLLDGLTRDADYTVRSGIAWLDSTRDATATITASSGGQASVYLFLPSSVPADVSSFTLTVSTAQDPTPLATLALGISRPRLLNPLCPGEGTSVTGFGFPDGTYTATSPGMTLSDVPVTARDSRLIFPASVGTVGPEGVEVTITSVDDPTISYDVVAHLDHPSYVAQAYTNWSEPFGVTCFDPGETVLVVPRDSHTVAPRTVVADAHGRAVIPVTLVPGSSPSATFGVVARGRTSDQVVDSEGKAEVKIPGTTLLPGQSLATAATPRLISPQTGFILYENWCTPVLMAALPGGGEHEVWETGAPELVDRRCRLTMTTAGALTEYGPTGKLRWSNGTVGRGNRLVMGTATQATVSTPTGIALWSTATGTVFRPALASRRALGAGQALVRHATQLQVGRDGNVVLYRYGVARWSSHTAGSGGTHLTMRADGHLVLTRPSGRVVWATHTHSAGAALHLSLNGDVVITTTKGHVVWRLPTGTR